MPTVKVGLCGFTISAAAYARRFPVVEVQQTFYQPPAMGTLARWRNTMPPAFEFTLKAWQLITHTPNSSTYRRLKRQLTPEERATAGAFRASAIVEDAWATTLACAGQLRATAILFQCPASFRPLPANVENLRGFFRRIDRPRNVRLLWEPRGPWPEDLVAALCDDLNLVHVVDPFVTRSVTTGWTYYRLHGNTGARHVYTDAELHQLASFLPREGTTYVMFNNMPRVEDSRRFEAVIAGTEAGASPLLGAPPSA
jgi:uncharacterized protein YecE (DUF72 family)